MNTIDNSYSNVLNQESEVRLETKTDQDEVALIIDDMVQQVIRQNTSELRQRVHDRNISIRQRLGMPPSKADPLKEHTAEESAVFRQELLKQVHDRNISTKNRIDKMADQDFGIQYNQSKTSDGPSDIVVKILNDSRQETRQKYRQEWSKNNDEMEKKLNQSFAGRLSFRTNDDPVDLTKLSLEERRAHRRANLQEVSKNNDEMEKN